MLAAEATAGADEDRVETVDASMQTPEVVLEVSSSRDRGWCSVTPIPRASFLRIGRHLSESASKLSSSTDM